MAGFIIIWGVLLIILTGEDNVIITTFNVGKM